MTRLDARLSIGKQIEQAKQIAKKRNETLGKGYTAVALFRGRSVGDYSARLTTQLIPVL